MPIISKATKRKITRSLAHSIGIPIMVVLLRILRYSWRIDVQGFEKLTPGVPVVFAMHHGQLLVAASMAHLRAPNIDVLTSLSRDGWLIERLAKLVNIGSIRGGSSRGQLQALRGVVTQLRQKKRDVIIAVDGPRGPRHEAKPGVILAACMAGVPIVVVGSRASRAWRFGSWDRLYLPKPFARVTLTFESMGEVDRHATKEELEEARLRCETRLREISDDGRNLE